MGKEFLRIMNFPCDLCHMGWANQDGNGVIDSCRQTCGEIFDWIVERDLIRYEGAWKQLAKM